MKKLIKVSIIVMTLFLMVGCGNMMNTPTKKVEQFLGKYQTQDEEVLKQLDSVVKQAGNLTESQQKEYRDLMKKQYQNMSYKIKDDTEDGNNATVEVEIEVYDYGKAINESEAYLLSNRDEFVTDIKNNVINTEKFLDYKIGKMKDTKTKITYTLYFTLTKVNDKWELDTISDVDRLKIHGLYY